MSKVAAKLRQFAGGAVIVALVVGSSLTVASQAARAQDSEASRNTIQLEPLPAPTSSNPRDTDLVQSRGADPLPNAPVPAAGQGATNASRDAGQRTGVPASPEELESLIRAAPSPSSDAAPDGAAANRSVPTRGEPDAASLQPTFRGKALSPKLTWRVESPFRFFSDPVATEAHRLAYKELEGAERRNPVLAIERRLAARNARGWAAGIVDATCWDGRVNAYRCDDRPDYLSPRIHRVLVSLEGIAEAATVSCQWTSIPRDTGINTAPPETVLQPCSEQRTIEVPYPAGADVSVSVGGVELQRATIAVEDLLIVGMGDSFASGEGNPDVPVRFSRERATAYGDAKSEPTVSGFPAREGKWKQIGDRAFVRANAKWLDQACHRSLYSHQLRAALQLAIEAPHRAVTYVGLACSGAEITDGLFLRYKGNEWVPNPPELSQISAAAEAQCDDNQAEPQDLPEAYHIKGTVPELGGLVLLKCPMEKARKIDLLFLSIGGNDIGFARLLANAILANQSTLRKLGGWFGQVHGQSQASGLIDTLDERYKALNRALHNILHIPWNESDRVLLTGYPGLALLGDGSQICPDGTAGMEVVSDFRLSAQKAREGVWISDKLNRIMHDSAAKHGWTFVDHHRRAFVDRGICAGFTDNAFSIADDLRLPRKIDGRWVPYNPADYSPYAPRQRWFRTPNDAFLTGNFHVAPSLLQKALKLKSLSYFQLVLAATYSGAFHPTAEGHAAIADALVEQSRAVLQKYRRSGGASEAGETSFAR
ncbi:MAG: hypothetical protein H6876_11550 [Hyphomicrobiaceae bacterium]|nr:hypothetical protein [Hyphomicrobiaceae bacterium]MCC0008740.1 hypothetical protein [Hyphomicrobiaceae bacterium]